MWLWPQFRSPLVWGRFFAVSTYFTVSLLFLVCRADFLIWQRFATRSKGRFFSQVVYGALALGWRGFGGSTGRAPMSLRLCYWQALRLRWWFPFITVVSFDFTIRCRSWLAQHDIPALFRGRRNFIPALRWS